MKRVVVAILMMLLPAECMAETARDAMVTLSSLVKQTVVSISYQDYAVLLGEAQSEVGSYLKGDEAKQNKKLSDTISEVMDLYEYADSLFKVLDDSKGLINAGADASQRDKKIASEYFSRFPGDRKPIAAGGVLTGKHGPQLKITAAINKIFRRASTKYAEAARMMNQ